VASDQLFKGKETVMPEPKPRYFIAPKDSVTWDVIFRSFKKTEEDVLERQTARGPLRMLELTEDELMVASRSRRDQRLSFDAFLEPTGGRLTPLSIKRIPTTVAAKRNRDPQVDVMRTALERQLARHQQSAR
jgi:hypothetical protein